MMPNPTADLIVIGTVRKAHGLHGEIKLQVKDAFVDDILKAKVVFLQGKSGPLPYFVSSMREAHELIAKFESVDSPEAARALYGFQLMLRRQDVIGDPGEDEEDQAPLEALVGYIIHDTVLGVIGPIEEIIELPQQLMAFVNFQEREVMIPLHAQFVKAVDHHKRRIKMELPEGLLTL